jgi:prepilin-type N-terminal cleavage/methylation domain-containing protein
MRRRNAGFTLVELTVALVAGLIVAMGVVGLSRAATSTFNEEMRNAGAEAALRGAIDRLRADLQRAGYMSTGNILLDPAMPMGGVTAASSVAAIPATMLGIRNLASILLTDGGSLAKNGLALSAQQSPTLAPDSIQIAGNMTTTEQFEVALIPPTANANGLTCQRILLSPTSGAMYRLNAVGAAAAGEELRELFQPVPIGLSTQFIVRVVDASGRTQYVATCPEAASLTAGLSTAGFDPTSTYPYVDIDSVGVGGTQLLTAAQTGGVSSFTGYGAGGWINPVQIVQWEITGPGGTDAEPAQYISALNNLPLQAGTADPNKYDLMRTYVDAKGALVPQTSEIVAEYAVDLEFAFTVETAANNQNLATSLVTYPFDSASSNTWAPALLAAAAANQGPERIRSVRTRLVTRTALPDRRATIPAQNASAETFLYRYCMTATGCPAMPDNTLRWARGRTITTEVALPNQSRSFY